MTPSDRNGDDRPRARRAIADLLVATLFVEESSEIPYALHESTWSVLKVLSEDPEPDQDYEATYGGSNMDPATLSLNTIRGVAFHGLIRYALWMRKHNPEGSEKFVLDALPELKSVLELHLQVAHDPSLAVRSVYGRWFPAIVQLDGDWASMNVDAVFPEDEDSRPYRDAAWNAYVLLNRPYVDVLRILEREYRWAMVNTVARGGSGGLRNPEEHLADHVVAMLLQDLPDDAGGLLSKEFFSVASPKLRSHALSTIGRWFSQDPGLPEEMVPRTVELWESRFPEKDTDELQAFGWTFASGAFDADWSIAKLVEILREQIMPEPNHRVAQRLASMAEEYPESCLMALDLMFEYAPDPWSPTLWEPSARYVLEVALSRTRIRTAAENLVHKLGAAGYASYDELLQDHVN